MTRFQLSLQGGFRACLDGHSLTTFETNKARGLLIFLAVEADRPHSRAKLAGLFWGELPEKRALANLRHSLANLRKILGDAQAETPFLLVTPQTLQFNRQSDHRLDTADLLAGLEAMTPHSETSPTSRHLATLEAALEGKDQPFLEGFFLDDCPAFEEWMLLTRERLQRQVLAGLQMLVNGYAQMESYDQAAQFARRAVALEPWQEEAHRQLIRILALSGQRSAALAQYEACRRLLAEELDVEPGIETVALYRTILAGEFDSTPAQSQAKGPPATTPHNLPAPLTPLIGREETIVAVQQIFDREQARLVTLTGPGGVGKTRLSLAVAQAMLASFPNGVYFVELAPVREAAFVLSALAETVVAHNTRSERPLLEQMIDHFRGQTALLVLDNFEHVLESGGLIAKLLAAVPHLRVLVTSRVRLRLRGEFAFVVPPLAVTNGEAPSGALELFRQRARAANQHFVLDSTNRAQAAALCARMDGLPLAIELAAARLKYDSLPNLLAGLNAEGAGSSLALLQAEFQDAPARQRSLWATIAWSYELLDEEEQRLFRRLAVFVGGWTSEAAQAVWGEGGGPALPVEEGLRRLVDTHLIHLAQYGADGSRYGMLETIREFGLAQLQRNDELLSVQAGHALFYRNLVERLGPGTRGAAATQALASLTAEYPNIRSSLAWATVQAEVDICLAFCGHLLSFWNLCAVHDALPFVEPVLAIAQSAPPSVAHVHTLVTAGYFFYILNRQPKGRGCFESALAMNEAIGGLGHSYQIGIAYGLLRLYQRYAGDYAAATATREAGIRYAYQSGDEWNLAIVLANCGLEFALEGQWEKGRAMAAEGLALFRRIGDEWGIILALTRMGVIHRLMGDRKQARNYLLEAERVIQSRPNRGQLYPIQNQLALLALGDGDMGGAARLAVEALHLAVELEIADRSVETLEVILQIVGRAAHYDHSLRLAGFLTSYYAGKGEILPPWQRDVLDTAIALARQHLPEEEANAAWQSGVALTLDQAVLYAQKAVAALVVRERGR